MSKRMKVILVAIAFLTAFIITFQAITIHNMKKEQEEQFYEHITAAAEGFEEYQKKGHAFRYDGAVRELRAAWSVARLLDDSADYKDVCYVLGSLLEKYSWCPGEPELFPDYLEPLIDDMIAALNDFSTDRNVENLYTKLHDINVELNKMRPSCVLE